VSSVILTRASAEIIHNILEKPLLLRIFYRCRRLGNHYTLLDTSLWKYIWRFGII